MIKAIISGGWGYGNLGDDAILVATLELLRKCLPDACLTVLTYDAPLTKPAVQGYDVQLEPSLHHYMLKEGVFRRYGYIDGERSYGSRSETLRRLRSKLQLSQYLRLLRAYRDGGYAARLSGRLLQVFSGAQLYVQSGGHYMNSRFLDGMIAHAGEIHIARENGAGIMSR